MLLNRESIEDVVKRGLVEDIFKMESAFALGNLIEERRGDIEHITKGNFIELFGTIQTALKTESILAAARIYDIPSRKYPTRCLAGVLNYLTDNKDGLPEIREPYQLQLHLRNMDATEALLDLINNEPKELAPQFSAFVESLLSAPLRQDALKKLKAVRDKVITHNEQAVGIVGPSWEALQDLIRVSKDVVGALGWAYFSTGYVINGEYILSGDAKRSAVALNKLLNLIAN